VYTVSLPSLIQLVRPANLAITAVTVVVSAMLAGAGWDHIAAIGIASFSCVFLAAAAYALNDLRDLESDRINHPRRPLVTGVISGRTAVTAWLVGTVVSLLTASLLHTALLLFAGAGTIALVLYNMWLKRVVIVGNVVAAGVTSLAVCFGAAVTMDFEAAIMPALFAFLANLAREMIKDVEDAEGDKSAGAKTLAVLLGDGVALRWSVVPLAMLVAATIEPFIAGRYGEYYLAIVLIADAMLLYCMFAVFRAPSRESLRRLSRLVKLSMAIGILALFASGW
jgi:geranylgeranylglycerol-phosphate geranylgeranyltransferase